MTTKAVMPRSVAGRIISCSMLFETRDSDKETTLYSNDDLQFLNDFLNTSNDETIIVCAVIRNDLEGNYYSLKHFLKENKIPFSDANYWLSVIEKLESKLFLKPINYKVLEAELEVRPHVLRAIIKEEKAVLDFLYCKSLVEMSDIVHYNFTSSYKRKETIDFDNVRNRLIARNPHLDEIEKLSNLSTASFFLLLYCIYESRKSWSDETWYNFILTFDPNANIASKWAAEIFANDNPLFEYHWIEIIKSNTFLDENIAFRLTAPFREKIFYINENLLVKSKKRV